MLGRMANRWKEEMNRWHLLQPHGYKAFVCYWLQWFLMVSLENGIPPKPGSSWPSCCWKGLGIHGFPKPPYLATGKDLAFWFPQIWSLGCWVWDFDFLDNHPTALAQDVGEDGKPLEGGDEPMTSSAASWLESFCVLLAPMVSLENGIPPKPGSSWPSCCGKGLGIHGFPKPP